MTTDVVVVIGAGAIGTAIGRREGTGTTVVLADHNPDNLGTAAETLRAGGHTVTTHPVDVACHDSVHALAAAAAELRSRHPRHPHRRTVTRASLTRSDSCRRPLRRRPHA